MDTNQIISEICASIDARIERLKAVENISQVRKWERERAYLAVPVMADYLSQNTTIPMNRIGDLAIYTVEKIRKIARKMVSGKGEFDNYTIFMLKKAKVLAGKKENFTFGLQRAALSKEIEVENAHKMGARLACTPGTANTQSCTTRAALAFLGVATNIGRGDDEKSDANYTVVDFNHAIAKHVLEPAAEKKAA